HDRLGGCEDPDGKGMPLPRWLDDDDLQLVVVLRPSASERDQVVLGVIDHEEDLLDVVRAPALEASLEQLWVLTEHRNHDRDACLVWRRPRTVPVAQILTDQPPHPNEGAEQREREPPRKTSRARKGVRRPQLAVWRH